MHDTKSILDYWNNMYALKKTICISVTQLLVVKNSWCLQLKVYCAIERFFLIVYPQIILILTNTWFITQYQLRELICINIAKCKIIIINLWTNNYPVHSLNICFKRYHTWCSWNEVLMMEIFGCTSSSGHKTWGTLTPQNPSILRFVSKSVNR